MSELRIEQEPIEITLGPDAGLLGLEPDVYRKFVPGRPRYFLDDIEVNRDEYRAVALAHWTAIWGDHLQQARDLADRLDVQLADWQIEILARAIYGPPRSSETSELDGR